MYDELNEVHIKFSHQALDILNIALAFIMFGVSLGIKLVDFKGIWLYPKAAVAGLVSQYLALPLITVGLVALISPSPYLALGMVLVAACPGGNVSNFFTQLAGGNVALSVALSMISTFFAFLLTPLQMSIWGGLLPQTSQLLEEVDIAFWPMFKVIATIMLLPLLLGMGFAHIKPSWARVIRKPVRIASFAILLAIIGFGLSANLDVFAKYYHRVVYIVLVHNGLALISGLVIGIVTGIGSANTKTIAIETGIQNTGLGLILIFNFFEGNGAMAVMAAWWGIWHMISGMAFSFVGRKWRS
jgi:BASS family bile acid:Na+ symporter